MHQQFDSNTKKQLMAFFYEASADKRLHFAYDQLLKSNKQLNAVKSSCITRLFNEQDPSTIMRELPEQTNTCIVLHADILRTTAYDASPTIVKSMRFKLAQEPVNTLQQMQHLSTRVLGTLIQKNDFWTDNEALKKVVYELLYSKNTNTETWKQCVDQCTELTYKNNVVLSCGELQHMMVQNRCELDENFEQQQHCIGVTKQLPYKVWMLTLANTGAGDETFLKVKIMPCSNLRASLVACSMHMSGFVMEKQTGRFDKHCHFRLHPTHGIHPADFVTMAIPHMRNHSLKIAQLYLKCVIAKTILLHDKLSDKLSDKPSIANINLHNYDETSLQLESVQLHSKLNAQQLQLAASAWQKSVQAGDIKVRCVHGSERTFNRDDLHTDVMVHTTHKIEASCSLDGVRLTFTEPLSISIFGTCFLAI
jgi:hypothetical protein